MYTKIAVQETRDIKVFLQHLLLLTVAGMLFSCHDKDDYTPPKTYTVQLQNNATLGSYLTDKDGRTLYFFASDSATVNTCAGGCALRWPVFNAPEISAANLGTGLNFSDFGQITTATGGKQTTYKGRPLYYYAPVSGGVNTPEAAGLTGGEAFGGVWFVAKPDYTIMLTQAQLVGKNNKKYTFDTTGIPTPTYTESIGKSVYFTDAKGVSLYIFKPDKQNKNTYTSATDAGKNATWPIYEMDKIVVPSALDKSLFGVIDVFGKKKLTYKGWPLYYYGDDAMVMGATKGVSEPGPGIWPVATRGLRPAPVQ